MGVADSVRGLPKRFRVLRQLGQGAQGDVLLVEDCFRGGVPCALKWAPVGGGVRGWTELVEEFRILAGLAHPGLARVRDFGRTADGRGAWMTSDWVRGLPLLDAAAELRALEGPEALGRALVEVADQGLAVLDYLRRRGVGHGDIKPQNLLVERSADEAGRRWRLRVVDFGSARLQRGASTRGATPAFRPPVDEEGRDGDLYAFGLSLYQAAVGRLPFALDDDARRAWWERDGGARLERDLPEAPSALARLVRGLTSRARGERFDTAHRAREALRRATRVPRPPAPPPRGRHTLLEREATLEEVLRRAFAVGWATVVGAPGSGKTAFLEALRVRALADGLETVLFESPADPSAVALLRELAARGSPVDDEAVAESLVDARRAPILILVDAADGVPPDEWPGLLAALGRRAGTRTARGRLALVAAGGDSADWAPPGVASGTGHVARLGPLSRDSIAALAAERWEVEVAPPSLVDAVEQVSGGVPRKVWIALERAAKSGVAVDELGELRVPRRAVEALGRAEGLASDGAELDERLRELAPATRWVAERLEVEEATPLAVDELLVLHGEVPGATAWDGELETLSVRGLARREIVAGVERWRLVAAVRGRVVSADIEGASREVADRVRELPAEWLERPPFACRALVRHLARAGAGARAMRAASRVVARWRRRGASSASLDVLLDALGAAPRSAPSREWIACILRTADVAVASGRSEDCRSLIAAARAVAPAPWRPWVRVAESRLASAVGDDPAASAALDAAVRDARRPRSERDVWHRVWLDAERARLRFRSGDAVSGRRRLRAALARVPARTAPAASRAAVFARCALAACELDHGDAARADEHLEAALVLCRRHVGLHTLSPEPLQRLAIRRAATGRTAAALQLFEELEESHERRGDRLGRVRAVYNRALVLLRGGDLAAAEDAFRTARRLSDAIGRHPFRGTVSLGLAGVLRERGEPLAALRLYRRVLRPDAGARLSDRVLAHNNAGEIFESFGRLDRALEEREHAVALARRSRSVFAIGVSLRNLGGVRAALGDVDGARAALEEALELAGGAADPRWQGGALYHLALLEPDDASRWRALTRARAACLRLADQPYVEACRIARCEWLLARGRRKAVGAVLARREPGGPRRRLGHESARQRADPSWPRGWEGLVASVDESVDRGAVWEAFQVARAALDDALPPEGRLVIAQRVERLTQRLTRRLDAEAAARFRRRWTLEGEGSRPQPRADGAWSELTDRALHWLASPEPLVAADLFAEAVRLALDSAPGARFVWRALDELGVDVPCPLPPTSAPPPGLLDALARGVEEARSSAGVARRLGLVTGALDLALAAPESGWSADEMARARAAVDRLAATVAPLLCVLGIRHERDRWRERSERAEAESRRLTVLIASHGSKTDLDTEPLGRRGGLIAGLAGEPMRAGRGAPVAASRVMRELLARLPRLAESRIPLLLLGESGVGKDFLARWIHHLSARRDRPFLAEACSIPESLLESELFGHEAGAFTDAAEAAPGLFRRAEGGTIYLDEVGDLPAAVQARLLRVLEERKVRPLGAARSVEVDFRLVASSRVTDVEALRDAALRPDLFYRVAGEIIRVPPLRERREDIEALVRAFVEEYARESGRRSPRVARSTLHRLEQHDWPGNVRELRNAILRALLDDPEELRAERVLQGAVVAPASGQVEGVLGLKEARDAFERQLVVAALRRCAGNASHAAEELRVTRRHMGKLLDKHGVDLAAFKRRPRGEEASPESQRRGVGRSAH